MTDLGNKRDIDKRTKAQRVTAARLKEALRYVMGDARGVLYLSHLVDQSGALRSIDGPDPDNAQFILGRRAMGIKLIEDVRSLDAPGSLPKNLTALMAGALSPPTEEKTDERNPSDDE